MPASTGSGGGGGGSFRGTIGAASSLVADAGVGGTVEGVIRGAVGGAVGGVMGGAVGGVMGGAVGEGGGEESSLRPLAVGSIGWSSAGSLPSRDGPHRGGGMDALDGDPSPGTFSPF